MSLKDQIAAFGSCLKVKKIDVEGLPDFYIREMSAGDRETIESYDDNKAMQNKLRACVFVNSVCDKTGKLLYTNDDIDEVNGYRMQLLVKVFNESNKINGITLGPVADVETELKNS